MNSLDLLYGGCTTTSSNVEIKQLKVSDIIKYGEKEYTQMISLFCSRPFDMVETLYENDIKFEDIEDYQLFVMLFDGYYKDGTKTFIDYFLGVKQIYMGILEEKVVFTDETKKNIIIDEKSYFEISEFLKIMSQFKNRKVEKFHSNIARVAYIENLIEEAEIYAEENKDVGSSNILKLTIALALSSSYKIDETKDMYLFPFFTLAKASIKKEEYNQLMYGIYAGTVDSKKINLEKHYWLNAE